MIKYELMEKYGFTYAELKVFESISGGGGDVVSKDKIAKFTGIINFDWSRAIDVHVCNIRKKVKKDYDIKNARGHGYYLVSAKK